MEPRYTTNQKEGPKIDIEKTERSCSLLGTACDCSHSSLPAFPEIELHSFPVFRSWEARWEGKGNCCWAPLPTNVPNQSAKLRQSHLQNVRMWLLVSAELDCYSYSLTLICTMLGEVQVSVRVSKEARHICAKQDCFSLIACLLKLMRS